MTLNELCEAIIDKYEEIVKSLEDEGKHYSMHILSKVMAIGLWAQRNVDYEDV